MPNTSQFDERRWINTGWLFALVSAALFALRPVLVKLVYAEGVDSTSLLAWRMLFSAPVYLLMLALLLANKKHRARITRKAVLASAAVGVLGYFGASWFDLLGLQYVTAQLGRMILYTYPGFVVLIGVLFMAQRLESKKILALLLTYAGVALIFAHDLGHLGDAVIKGALFISAASICFACYLVFSKSLVAVLGSRLFTCIALLSASAVIIVFAAQQGLLDSAQVPETRPMALIFVIAIFCTVIPSFCTAEAIARIGADRTSIAAMTGPVFTSVAAVSILGEVFTMWHLLGTLLVVLGVWRTR